VRRYDAVFLDAQGTLLAAHPSVPALYAGAFLRLGKRVDPRQVATAVGDLWSELKRAPTTYDTSDEATREWWANFNSRLFQRLGMEDGLEQFLEETWETFGQPKSYRPYPEVMGVLAELRNRGYRLGVVSNWDSRLLLICEKLGIATLVDFVLASAVVGVEKPDRRIFDMALARAGVPPYRALHVGDDYEADVLGAQGAGIDALHLDRDGAAHSGNRAIQSLEQLLEILP